MGLLSQLSTLKLRNHLIPVEEQRKHSWEQHGAGDATIADS